MPKKDKEYNAQPSTSNASEPHKKSSWTHLPHDLEEKILDLTGPIQLQAKTIRQQPPINWKSYVDDNSISYKEYSFIQSFQMADSKDERDALLDFYKDEAFTAIRKMVQRITNVKHMKQFLVMIDDMLWEDEDRTVQFKLEETETWKEFMHLLHFEDTFVQNAGSRIISMLIFYSKVRPKSEDIKFYFCWLKEELKPENPYVLSVARCLQMLLRQDDYRRAFMTLNGIFQIVKLLTTRVKPQMQYQFSFCLWLTSFNPYLAEKMNRAGTIPVLAEILQNAPQEIVKLPRVILATYRNLLEKPREMGVKKHNALVMIQCKMIQYLDNIKQRVSDSNDPEYSEDYEFIANILSSYVAELNTFEEYYYEVKSRRLEWSMVHKSKKFWVENAERLNENRYELLKILISLLETSHDNVVLCIAANDLGEYMKIFGRGKKIVEDLGGKSALIRLLSHRHSKVRYFVLKTLQILMLNNYELFAQYYKIARNISEDWVDADPSNGAS